jgi:hypothetical protein
MTPFPRASTAVAAPVAAPQVAPAPEASASDPTPALIAGVAGVVLLAAAALVAILRRSRGGRIPAGVDGARRA